METPSGTLETPFTQPLSQLFDTTIDNYSIAELFSMLGLSNEVDADTVKNITDHYYQQYLSQDRNVAYFFLAVQTRLLTYLADVDIDSKQYTGDPEDQPLPSEALESDGKFSDGDEDQMQNSLDQFKEGLISEMDYEQTNRTLETYEDKIRKQANKGKNTVIQNFVQSPNLSPWMNSQDEDSGGLSGLANITNSDVTTQNASSAQSTSKVFETAVKQGKINPDVKNTTQRLVNVDSSYRKLLVEGLGAADLKSDDFVFTLNETLTSVLSLTLYSLELPYAWYNFTSEKGMTGMRISTMTASGDPYPDPSADVGTKIPEGNYTGLSLLQAVEDALNGFIYEMIDNTTTTLLEVGPGPWWTLTQDPLDGKTIISAVNQETDVTKDRWYYPYNVQLTWFDISFTTSTLNNATLYSNLGWALGYRLPITILLPLASTPPPPDVPDLVVMKSASILDTNGTKYIIMKLNDYKTNRLNKALVSIDSSENTKIDLPNYINPDTQRSRFTKNDAVVYAVGTAPRLLTAKQLYTINAISDRNAVAAVRLRGNSPDDADVFAKIPMKKNVPWSTYDPATGISTVINDAPATPLVDFSGPLQNNIREYFGPVDITNLHVTLYDDKGYNLDLNGIDWSFTLLVKSLYQY